MLEIVLSSIKVDWLCGKITPADTIRIIEDDGTTKSTRISRFNDKQHKVAVFPKVGKSHTNNCSLIQPPEPYKNNNRSDLEIFPNKTEQLISIIKKTL